MRAYVALLLSLLLAVFTGAIPAEDRATLPPDGAKIGTVRVEGLARLKEADILRVMELHPGAEFKAAAYRNDLQAISNTGKVDPIDTKILWQAAGDNAVDLTVLVKENPPIDAITVVGNVKYSEDQIKSQLDYKVGDITPTGARAATIRNIQKFYAGGGYKSTRVTVTVKQPASEAEGSKILIAIDEGARIKIKKLVLRGNTHFSDIHVRLKLSNAPGLLFFSNYFDEIAVEDDVAVLKGMYEDDGFLDAQVSSADFEYNRDKKEVTVIFDVVEGPRYTVKDVAYEKFTLFTKEELDGATAILPGRLYNGERLTKAIDAIRKLYGEQAYVDTQITNRLDKDTAAAQVTIVLVAEEAPETYVGDIRLQKEDFSYDVEVNQFDKFMDWFAPPIKDEAIYKEVRLKTGEKYRSSQEERTIQRLKNLGIFRQVTVKREPTADPKVKDAVIALEEDPNSAFVGVSAGIGQYSGPAVTFEFVQPNWGGNADRFRASATIGTNTTAYRLSYFNRYLGDSKTSMDTSIYRTTDRFRAYRQRIYGSEVEFGHPYTEHLTGYYALRAERVDFRGYDHDVETDMEGYPVLAFRPTVQYDKRENNYFPTRGYQVGGGFETGYADGFMFKLLHNFEWYKRLNRDNLTYAYQHTVGLMPMDADQIGLSERFFVGGSGTLRGFRYKEVGPRDKGDKDLATGGATRITQRHELRYPFNDHIRGRIFTDAAILESNAFSLGGPRVGSGAGVSFDLGPVGVDVDLATPVIREKNDRAQFLHLKVGSKF